MTALARPVAIKPPEIHELSAAYDDTNSLVLTGNSPQHVYVKFSGTTPEFSSDNATWYTEMSWTCDTGDDAYALIITYNLLTGVDEMGPSTTTPTLWFSPVIPASGTNTYPTQIGYLPPVTAQTTFNVSVLQDGVHYDPQIIVTPA
jgi:hypothetical protein